MDVGIDLRASLHKQRGHLSWLYNVEPENLYQHELGKYRTYGIRVTAPDCTDILHDVAVCEKTATHIVDTLNHYQVSPVHLYDVVTDMLP